MITFVPLSVPYAPASDVSVRTTTTTDAVAAKAEPSSNTGGEAEEVEQPKALAYLLQIDDIRVLIDCGAPEDFLFAPLPAAATGHPSSDPTKDASDAVDAANQPESSAMARDRAEGLQQPHQDLEHLAEGPLDQILARLAPTIDLVLLSHSTLSHLGLYAYAYARLGLRALVYATMPVQSMGKLTVTEAVEAWRNELDVDREANLNAVTGGLSDRRCLATLEEIDQAFEHVKTVRYLQPTHLEGKCTGVTLTAYSAGHSLGGAIWKLRSPTSGTILIALDWNHNRERHLDGTALLASSAAAAPSSGGASSGVGGVGGGPAGSGGISDAVRRPDLLITEIHRGLVVNVRRKDRDAALLDLVHKTIQGGHSVLFPVDPSARLLELLVLLDQHWAYAYPHAKFPLCLVSRTGKEVLERSRTYMEWMTREWATKAGEAAVEDGGGGGDGSKHGRHQQNHRKGKGGLRSQVPSSPLDFKFLKVFPTLAALDDAVPRDQAKVVLAVPPSMTHGPSRRLFARFAEDPQNLVVLLQRGQPGSLSRSLWDAWHINQNDGFRWNNGKLGTPVAPGIEVQFDLQSKVPLEGEELRAHLEAEKAEKEKLAQQRALLARSRRRLEADEDESSDEDESDSDDEELGGGDRNGLALRPPTGKIEGGGFAEPGSLGRKRNRAVAFDKGGDGTDGLQDGGMGGNGEAATQVSFDIYLKGNASRATSFFGAKPNQEGPFGVGVRYRLFPVVERKRRIDGYGETVDVARWLSRRRLVEAAAAAAEGGVDADKNGDDPAGKRRRTGEANGNRPPPPPPPSKFISEHVTVQVRCRLAFIEMEGLNDGRALKTLIPQMHPRRLITVNGDRTTRQDMLAALSAVKSLTKEVFAPAMGVRTRIGELTNSYAVVLGDSLLAGLSMSRFEDYEVGHVRAGMVFGAESTIPTLELASPSAGKGSTGANRERGEAEEARETTAAALVASIRSKLSQLPSAAAPLPSTSNASVTRLASGSTTQLGQTLFVGDLKLSTLKSALGSSSYRLGSEFAGEGMLVCGAQSGSEAVTIRKESQGRIVIEGNVGRAVRTVRRAVYELHARVVGQ